LALCLGVWVLQLVIACLATASMLMFALMDLNDSDEFLGGQFDSQSVSALFTRIDGDSDGSIDRAELEDFLVGTFQGRALPRASFGGSDALSRQKTKAPEVREQVRQMMLEADPEGAEGERKISLEAFEKLVGVGRTQCIDAVFDYIERRISKSKGEGQLDAADMRQAFALLGFDVRDPVVVELMASMIEAAGEEERISKDVFRSLMLPKLQENTKALRRSQVRAQIVTLLAFGIGAG